jgi:hypothetical protein
MLKSHFAYVDKPVSCKLVRPFIPTLLNSAVTARVPTPITVHLDNCSQCRRDLETVRKLGLEPGQLCRLGELFADVLADNVSKIEQLHKTVYDITERPESDVVTIYHIDEAVTMEVADESEKMYEGFPVRVEVRNRQSVTGAGRPTIPASGSFSKQEAPVRRLRPVFKIGIAAAAVVLVGSVLLFKTSQVRALTIDRIYQAIEKVKNVYITKFITERTEPVQEKWVSRVLNIYAIKTGEQTTIWDITRRVKKTVYLDSDSIETTSLSDDEVAAIEEEITGFWGLVPFYHVSNIPEDAEWRRVADDSIETTVQGTEAYELVWTDKKYSGSPVVRKWRVFADPHSAFPRRAEWYQRLGADDEFTLETTILIDNLSEAEVQSAIKAL